MSNELAPEGPELQPDGMGDFAAEEAGSEDASHLLPPIRELPQEREFLPGAFYGLEVAAKDPAQCTQQLGEILGQGLFQSLTDVHLFGRAQDADPWLEVGPMSPEPPQVLAAQELLPATGEPLAADDLEMFEMVAGRVAKTLGRVLNPTKESPADAAQRSAGLAGLKGQFGAEFGLALAGDFNLADVTDCCLSLGMKRAGGAFAWLGGRAAGDAILRAAADGAELAPGAQGKVGRVTLSFHVASVTQPGKALERAFAALHYLHKRLGGTQQMLDGSAITEGVPRGEHPALAAEVKRITDTGLRPGHIITRRLL